MATIKAQAIVPKNTSNPDKLLNELLEALDDAAETVQIDYDATTVTWAHDAPSVIDEPALNVRVIGIDDPIWNMLDQGTKPHTIRPYGQALAFQSGFVAKTQPGVIGSQRGGASGRTVYAKSVQHPGTVPRGWTEKIAAKHEGLLQKLVDGVLEKFDL